MLASKHGLHRISRQWLTEAERQDLLMLAASAFVVLPLLPDHTIDPWDAINPRRLWVLVAAIMAIASIGYLVPRIFGTRFGLAIAGVAGGFVSSTATVLTMADRAKAHPTRTASASPCGSVHDAPWTRHRTAPGIATCGAVIGLAGQSSLCVASPRLKELVPFPRGLAWATVLAHAIVLSKSDSRYGSRNKHASRCPSPLRSDLCLAAVYEEFGCGDVAGFIRCEE